MHRGRLIKARSALARVLEEETVVVAEDKVIDLLLYSLESVLDQSFGLALIGHTLTLACDDVVGLLQGIHAFLLLRFVFEQAAFEWLRWVEVDFLSHHALLVL